MPGTLLAIPNPLLLSPHVVLTYCAVHAVWSISGLADVFLHLNQVEGFALAFDLFGSLIDAVTRSEGIMYLGVNLVRKHSDPTIASSPLAAIIVATILGGGTLLVMDVFDLASPTGKWSVRTPEFVTRPGSLLATDLWSSALLAFLHLALTSKEGFSILASDRLLSGYETIIPSGAQRGANLILSRLTSSSVKAFQLKQSSAQSVAGKLGLAGATGYLSERDTRIVLTIVLFSIFAAERISKSLNPLKLLSGPSSRSRIGTNGTSATPIKTQAVGRKPVGGRPRGK